MLALIILHIFFVSFTDKPEKSAPALSPRAIEQRALWHIPTDGMDYPVSPMYQNELRKMGIKIHHVSRWFNGATCEMDSTTALKVKDLSFVTDVEITREDAVPQPPDARRRIHKWDHECMDDPIVEDPLVNATEEQLALYNLHPLHEAGHKGKGILMTVCDGGFGNANTLDCLSSKALGTFDFTDDKTDFFDAGTGLHGTACLSTIVGSKEDYNGAATDVQYYLMRSEEHDTESPKEMDNLVVALEKADSLGVNIFSVSLGYSWFDKEEWTLPKSALDGKTTRASRAATIAARKGMLVCAAAGNEGNKEWLTISVPADADSIITGGAVGLDSIAAVFSSFGPSADGRIKPEACAVGQGTALLNTAGEIIHSNGTSFATPLIAGMAACLWSAYPKENAMQIRERIIRSTDRYDHPDYGQYGYGIPDAWKAYNMQITDISLLPSEINYQKILRNGQVVFLREGRIYDILGRRIE